MVRVARAVAHANSSFDGDNYIERLADAPNNGQWNVPAGKCRIKIRSLAIQLSQSRYESGSRL